MKPIFQLNRISREGGLKKGRPTLVPTAKNREGFTIFGALRLEDSKFYWKSAKTGKSGVFINFLAQIRRNSDSEKIVCIVDNASIHTSKKVQKWLAKHEDIKVLYLPPYSPEYNPVEQVWKWIKRNLYSTYGTLSGAEELKQRFRRLCWCWQSDYPGYSFVPGMGIWDDFL